MEKKKNNSDQKPLQEQARTKNEGQRSSAFKESHRGDQKSTSNIEEEVELEQERKEAMTERD